MEATALIICLILLGIVSLGNGICWFLFFTNANLWIKHGDKEIKLNNQVEALTKIDTENKNKIEQMEKKIEQLIEIIQNAKK